MDGRDFIAAVLIVFLSLWGALYLETGLANYFVLELFVILLLTITASGILYGIAAEKDWAWPTLAAFFLLALVNCTLIYLEARNTTPFVITSFVNLAGFAVGVSMALKTGPAKSRQLPELQPEPEVYEAETYEENDLTQDLETYEIEPEALVQKKEGKKTAKKRKTAGKKKSKKRAAKRKKR